MTMPRFAIVLILLSLTGCDYTDPYLRAGAWRPGAVNDANLRAMVLVPSDLAVASPSTPADGALAAAALTRLRHDQVRPLMNSGLATITISGAPAAQPAAATPAAGGP
jgi:hypothetical protein